MSGQLLGSLIGPFETFGFMRVALVASFALALANGPVGTLLLMRRESLNGNVLSHAVMPGAALGFLYAGYSLAALSFGGSADRPCCGRLWPRSWHGRSLSARTSA